VCRVRLSFLESEAMPVHYQVNEDGFFPFTAFRVRMTLQTIRWMHHTSRVRASGWKRWCL